MSTPFIHLLMLENYNKLNKKNTDNTTLDNNTLEINGNSNQCINRPEKRVNKILHRT